MNGYTVANPDPSRVPAEPPLMPVQPHAIVELRVGEVEMRVLPGPTQLLTLFLGISRQHSPFIDEWGNYECRCGIVIHEDPKYPRAASEHETHVFEKIIAEMLT